MATREEKKTLKSAGKDEKKILKSLKKLISSVARNRDVVGLKG